MAKTKISFEYDNETGEYSCSLNGKKIDNVTGVGVYVPSDYNSHFEDHDENCTYCPKIYCNVTTYEAEGDIRKSTMYSTAGEKSSKRYPGLYIQAMHKTDCLSVEDELLNYFSK